MAETPTAAEDAARQILGTELNGYQVTEVLIEERANIQQELYAAVTHDSATQSPLVIFSTAGGMDIEEVHATTPEKVLMVTVPILEGLDLTQAQAIVQRSELDAGLRDRVAAVLVQLYTAYRQLDAQLVEINPLAVTAEGRIVALDCKLVIDEAAHYRQTELPPERATGTQLERKAKAQNFLFVELDGDVGVLANGAGLTMATMDAVVTHGGRPANFLEVGGEAYKRAKPALSLVLANPNVKSLLVNLCGAYARTDVIIEGFLSGWQALNPDLPVSFCIHGTGEERAQQLVRDTLGIEPHEHMDDAIREAIKFAAEANANGGGSNVAG